MIHYHGGPITPLDAALACWQGRHAMISFAAPEQVTLAAEVCQSYSFDNGAFSMWRSGKIPDWQAYYAWVDTWRVHPGFDWAIIPDVIDGSEEANDKLLASWPFEEFGVPVWHLHETLERLERLCATWPRIALGSSGKWATVGNDAWWKRMARAMEAATENGKPKAKLHGLRMLNVEVYKHLPLASADSTNVAQNVGIDNKWRGTYQPGNKAIRAAVLTQRIESHNSASQWMGIIPQQEEFALQ